MEGTYPGWCGFEIMMSYSEDGSGSLFNEFLEESPVSYSSEGLRLGLIDNGPKKP